MLPAFGMADGGENGGVHAVVGEVLAGHQAGFGPAVGGAAGEGGDVSLDVKITANLLVDVAELVGAQLNVRPVAGDGVLDARRVDGGAAGGSRGNVLGGV